MPSIFAGASIDQVATEKLAAAFHSNLNWTIETKKVALSEISAYKWGKLVRPIDIPREPSALQLNLYSDRRFRCLEQDKCADIEKPASLVIAIHPNGSISFLASGFSSAHANLYSKYFTLAIYSHANELAGVVGRKRVRRHIKEFEKIACYSLTEFLPTQSAGRFISKLNSRSNKFRSLYESISDARRAEVAQNAALAGGLAAGLISSTIFPLIPAIRSTVKSKMEEIPRICREEAADFERCLSSHNYKIHELASELMAPQAVILLAMALTLFSLYIVKSYIRR